MTIFLSCSRFDETHHLPDAPGADSLRPVTLPFLLAALATATCLSACAPLPPAPSPHHLAPATPVIGQAPEFIHQPPLPPPPQPAAAMQRDSYSVIVHNVDASELLFALVRDGKLNADIHPGISGTVTMNALDQSLPEILERIAEQVDIRYKLSNQHLSVQPDSPYLKNYRLDYPNIQRNVQSSVSTSTNLGASGSPALDNASSSPIGGTTANSSITTVSNITHNRFWETTIANLRDLLHETDKLLPAGSSETISEHTGQQTASLQPGAATAVLPNPSNSNNRNKNNKSEPIPASLTQQGTSIVRHTTFREAASVIANPENGLVSVRASERQHKKVREFLDAILSSARRQVLIEATIVEVDLSDRYQQGIDWSIVRTLGSSAGSQLTVRPGGPYSSSMATGGMVASLATLSWQKARGRSDISAAIKLLESFGSLRVLSSPKISVLNNQSSLLKVVDNEVYFTITATAGSAATATSPALEPTYQTSANTVPIGFLMSVTPQISASDEVILNLRPTISRISGYALDPNPVLAANHLSNPIPIIQTREMESLMRVQSGEIAILGGLMQDTRNERSDEVPGLNRVPAIGEMFKFKDNLNRKSELVVFLRPTVIRDASLAGDFSDYRPLLSDAHTTFNAANAATAAMRSQRAW